MIYRESNTEETSSSNTDLKGLRCMVLTEELWCDLLDHLSGAKAVDDSTIKEIYESIAKQLVDQKGVEKSASQEALKMAIEMGMSGEYNYEDYMASVKAGTIVKAQECPRCGLKTLIPKKNTKIGMECYECGYDDLRTH